MNVNDYGVVFAFYTAFDMSAYSSISITLYPPNPGIPPLVVSNPKVTVPSVPFTYPGGSLPANEYAQYTFEEGDIAYAGTWTARVTYSVAPSIQLISDVGSFLVGP